MCIDPSGFGRYNYSQTAHDAVMCNIFKRLQKWPANVVTMHVYDGKLYFTTDKSHHYRPVCHGNDNLYVTLNRLVIDETVKLILTPEMYTVWVAGNKPVLENPAPVEDTVTISYLELQSTMLKAQAEVLTELKQLSEKIAMRQQQEQTLNLGKWNSARVIIEKVGVTTFFQFDKTGLEKYINNLIESKIKFRVEYLYN